MFVSLKEKEINTNPIRSYMERKGNIFFTHIHTAQQQKHGSSYCCYCHRQLRRRGHLNSEVLRVPMKCYTGWSIQIWRKFDWLSLLVSIRSSTTLGTRRKPVLFGTQHTRHLRQNISQIQLLYIFIALDKYSPKRDIFFSDINNLNCY